MSKNEKYERDAAASQLPRWYEKNKGKIGYSNNAAGIDVVSNTTSLTAGKYGPIVLRDYNLLQNLQRFTRERIPERVVHAKGAGAFGYFECTKAITNLTVSKVFDTVGKKTPIAVRFSQIAEGAGSADTIRDSRGFAVKFYTDEGNWDLVGNNTPIFFLRDPMLFPIFTHSRKKNPVTNVRDPDMFWDFLTSRHETIHQVMIMYSDRGIPDGHRHMDGFGSHTFSLIGPEKKLTWVKFVLKTDQGIKNLDPATAMQIAGKDPDYAGRDLYNAIETKKCPTWTFYIQTMTPEQAEKQTFNPFDITKVWPLADFPLQKIGTLVLNKNPTNAFAEVEQLSFNPNNLTPGIGPSPDRLLQGRLFVYHDSHLHRLGTNFQQLPVNRPINKVQNFQRDGNAALNNQNGAPTYYPNVFGGPEINPAAKKFEMPAESVNAEVGHYDLGDEDNYSQPRVFWNKVCDDGAKQRLVDNLVDDIGKTREDTQNKAVEMFRKVDVNFGDRIKLALGKLKVHL